MKKRTKTILGLLIAAVVCGGVAGGVYLGQQQERTDFFNKITVNGFDVSGKQPEEVGTIIRDAYSAPKITVTEGKTEEAVFTLEEIGFAVDEEKLLEDLKKLQTAQKSSFLVLIESLVSGGALSVDVNFNCDEAVFAAAVNAAALKDARVPSTNAELSFDETAKEYSIKEETYGTEFADEDFQKYVKAQVTALTSADTAAESLRIEVPKELYIKPTVFKDDAELNRTMTMYNRYCKATVNYTFGPQAEVLDWKTIKDWVVIDGESVSIDAGKARDYVEYLARNYNTIYYDRTFHTSLNTDVVIVENENEYGYLVNEKEELARLLADVDANAETTREPVYSYSAAGRNGRDDLNGYYVEVNLTRQHLWFYKNGQLVVESDLVSGIPTEIRETHTGVYPLDSKESPKTLTGEQAGTSWSSDVTFWMPFTEGQGLHDAPWRSSFGGSIYTYNGSHGCVNLPYRTAEIIYNNIDVGTPIVLYREG